ncbi:MAG: isoprenyl transferase [Christensenellales bacterium]
MNLFQKIPETARLVDLDSLPKHVAIIMDGNGRWAKARALPRMMGHRAGVERLRDIVAATSDLNIPVLTVYAFSAENWKRPKEEVGGLMRLLIEYLEKELLELAKNGVRITFLGSRKGLSDAVLSAMDHAAEKTRENSKMVLNLAFNYGGRQSIARTARYLAELAAKGSLNPDAIDEALFAKTLNVNDLPDPDVVIRTSGEYRLSNFLPFETAYSELVFTDTYWPDFDERAYLNALAEYQRRNRRFGGL